MQGLASKYLGIRVPLALGERLEAPARRENNHISAVTRRLLTAALDREEKSHRPRSRSAKRGL
jgi:hypothetical protein